MARIALLLLTAGVALGQVPEGHALHRLGLRPHGAVRVQDQRPGGRAEGPPGRVPVRGRPERLGPGQHRKGDVRRDRRLPLRVERHRDGNLQSVQRNPRDFRDCHL
ncbi:hypothetical protein FOCC_FOCC012742 [Frankliniella occidentalis]|nr:hypothetical protein FOCC_FOCC012742 [Frankliniella occidentalis]